MVCMPRRWLENPSIFHLIAGLISLAAGAAYLNYRLLRLPPAIGMMLIVLAASVALVLMRAAGAVDPAQLVQAVEALQFGDVVLHGMLGLLLFAGALHIDLAELARERWAVGLLATAGVAISTAVAGGFLWLLAPVLGFELPLVWALLFGAVISPTDPIAVLTILHRAGVPRRLELRVTGESLFNDGMALVLFLALLQFAAGEHPSAAEISVFLAREAGGALLFGALLGLAAVRLLSGIDDYSVEILMTLAVAMGGYAAAEALHVSAPITVAVTGLLIGNRGRGRAMTEQTRRRLDQFWELVDYLLTSLLFVMIALEIFTLEWSEATAAVAWLAAASVLIALAARLASVALPLAALAFRRRFAPGTLALLTWGGLKGGVSIALALSLPASGPRELLLALTYAVAVFSIVIQGLTLRQVAERLVRKG